MHQAAEVAAGNIWQNTDTYVAVADYVNAIKKQQQPLTTPQEAAHISPEDLRAIRVVSHFRFFITLYLLSLTRKEVYLHSTGDICNTG